MALTIMRMCAFRRKVVSDKTSQIFRPPLPAEYVTVFSGPTEVRCDLKQTDRRDDYSNPPAHARRELNTE